MSSSHPPVVGRVSAAEAEFEIALGRPCTLPFGATALAVPRLGARVEVVVILPVGAELRCDGLAHRAAAVLAPGDSFVLVAGEQSRSLRLVATPCVHSAPDLGLRCCDICLRPLGEGDRVAICAVCGTASCLSLCATAGQCTECGASLPEVAS